MVADPRIVSTGVNVNTGDLLWVSGDGSTSTAFDSQQQAYIGARGLLPDSTASTATTGTLTAGQFARLDTTSAAATRTLPTAAAAGAGALVAVKVVAGSNTVTVNRAGSDTINGSATSRVVTPPEVAITLASDGVSNWSVVSTDTPASQLSYTYVQKAPDPTGVAATDRAAIQAAINALPSTGGRVLLGPGSYALGTTGLTITKPVLIEGCGGPSATWTVCPTEITYTSATGTAISITTPGVTLRDFGVRYTGGSTPTAGAGIAVSGTAPNGYGCRFTSVGVMGFYTCFSWLAGAEWWMSNCFAYDAVQYGIYCDGVIDFRIMAPQLISGPNNLTPRAAILLRNAGGVNITSPKVNNRGTAVWVNGVEGVVPDGFGLEDWEFLGGSYEGIGSYGIKVRHEGPSNTGTLAKVQWSSLEMASRGAGIYAISFVAAAGTDKFAAITDGGGNIFQSWGAGYEFNSCARVRL